MTTNDQKVTTVRLTATVVREQEDVVTVRLSDGFSNQEVVVHRHAVTRTTTDDYVRLPLLLAAAMTEKLRANDHKGGRANGWLATPPKVLLARLQQEVDELQEAIRLHPERVLPEAADVANFAMMIADKADKLEPMPELIDVE